MADIFTKQKRSEVMAKVPQKNTSAELIVRRSLHSRGFRFRVNQKQLPGSPDIVLPKYRTAIFVHGCFCTDMKVVTRRDSQQLDWISGGIRLIKIANAMSIRRVRWQVLDGPLLRFGNVR